VVQVVALTGALADAGEDGEASVRLGDVVNQLHNHDRLADTGTAEEADLATLGVRLNQINHFDTGGQNLLLDRLLDKLGGVTVNGVHLGHVDRATLVDGLANHVDNPAQATLAHRHLDGGLGVQHLLAAHKALGGVHSNGTDGALAQVLRHLQHQPDVVVLHLQSVQNVGQVPIKLNVNNRADNLRHLASLRRHRRGGGDASAAERRGQTKPRGAHHGWTST